MTKEVFLAYAFLPKSVIDEFNTFTTPATTIITFNQRVPRLPRRDKTIPFFHGFLAPTNFDKKGAPQQAASIHPAIPPDNTKPQPQTTRAMPVIYIIKLDRARRPSPTNHTTLPAPTADPSTIHIPRLEASGANLAAWHTHLFRTLRASNLLPLLTDPQHATKPDKVKRSAFKGPGAKQRYDEARARYEEWAGRNAQAALVIRRSVPPELMRFEKGMTAREMYEEVLRVFGDEGMRVAVAERCRAAEEEEMAGGGEDGEDGKSSDGDEEGLPELEDEVGDQELFEEVMDEINHVHDEMGALSLRALKTESGAGQGWSDCL